MVERWLQEAVSVWKWDLTLANLPLLKFLLANKMSFKSGRSCLSQVRAALCQGSVLTAITSWVIEIMTVAVDFQLHVQCG